MSVTVGTELVVSIESSNGVIAGLARVIQPVNEKGLLRVERLGEIAYRFGQYGWVRESEAVMNTDAVSA